MKIALALAVMAGLVAQVPAAQAASAAPSDTPAPTATATAVSARPVVPPAATTAAVNPGAITTAPAGPVLVARWDFNAGPVGGKVADTSGRGPALTLRGADRGEVRFLGGATGGKYVAFPDVCAKGASSCPRGLLEAGTDTDLNPGTRMFRWSATVHLTRAQIAGSANIMQKGVANTGSQWKMQVGATQGRAQCVLVGVGSPTVYIARSASSVADAVWHKVMCQRSGTSLAVFIDGVQRGQTTIPSTLSIANALPLRIGGPNFNKTSDMYHGLLDDVYAELG